MPKHGEARHRVPLRRSLLVRLLATSILIAVCAVAATAWLAVRTTSRAFQQQQGQTLAADNQVYDELLGYGATHTDWPGVEPLLAEESRRTGRQIVLTDGAGRRVAASAGTATNLPGRPSAVIDPLHVETTLRDDTGTAGIDPRAVGPYRLTAQEQADVHKRAAGVADCLLTDEGQSGVLTETPSGRTVVTMAGHGAVPANVCDAGRAAAPTPTEQRALDRLGELVVACLQRQGTQGYLVIAPDFTWIGKTSPPTGVVQVPSCMQDARREQLRPYVATPVRLYVDGPAHHDSATFTLSGRNAAYIAGVTGLVLLLAIVVTVLAGRRLIRPLRILTAAAQPPLDWHTPVAVTGDDEIGRLTAAFNDLAARRQAAEHQRKIMVSDIAHELRTPLTNMRIWLEAAQDGLAPLDAELLDLLNEETVLLQHVVDDLRDLAAADSGSLRLDITAVDVGEIVRQVVTGHRGTAESAGVQLVTTVGDDLAASLDPMRLRQIVGNLVANALRHTPPGGRVTVSAGTAGSHLVVEVADTGAGISAADLPHVFDRFWRADKARSRNAGGSGLGLAIARQLAEAHHGDLTARSTTGLGSTFTLHLPR